MRLRNAYSENPRTLVLGSVKIILLGLLGVILIASPVLAYLYRAPYTVEESDGNAYTMLPVWESANNLWMVDNGIIVKPSALDTRIETLGGIAQPRMLTYDKTLAAVPVPANSQTNLSFSTGNADANMDIITGYNGYVTTPDSATLELGNNGSIVIDSYVDTTAGVGKNLVNKQNALSIYTDPSTSGTVNATIGQNPNVSLVQVIVGGSGDTIAATSTEFNVLMGGGNWDATESNVYQVMPTAGTISRMYIRLSANVAAGTAIFTLMKNGAPQALTVTISAGSATGSDLVPTDAVSFAAGDTVSLKYVTSGASGTPRAQWTTQWNSTTPNESIFLLNALTSSANTYYSTLQGGRDVSITETEFATPMPTGGILSKLYVQLSTNPGSGGDNYVFTLRKAGDTALTTTITNAATAGHDITHTVAVVAGDLVDMKMVPGAVPTNSPAAAIGMVFTPTVSGESVVMGGCSNAPATGATNYSNLCPAWVWNATETNVYQLTQLTVLSKLYVNLTVAPDNGAGVDEYTFTVMEAGGSTGLVVNIQEAATTGHDTTHTWTSSNGAVTDMGSAPANTPASSVVHWGLVSRYPSVTVSVAGITPTAGEKTVTFTGNDTGLLLSVDSQWAIGSFVLSGGNAWVEKAPTLGAEEVIFALAVYNGKLYGGTYPNGKLYEWNGVNAWVEKAPTLGAEAVIVSLAVYNGKLYGGTYPNGKLYEWNGVNAWVEKAPQLGAEAYIFALAVFNSKLYGGTDPNGKLYEWNGVNAWVEKAPQLGAEVQIFALAVYNGKLYGGTGPNGKLYEWNGVNAWVEKAPTLGAEAYIFALAVYNGKLYGGTYPNGKLYEWNGVNAWVEKAPTLGAEAEVRALAVYNGKLYGGTYPNGKLYEWNGVIVSVPDNDAPWIWNQGNVMPYATSIVEETPIATEVLRYEPNYIIGGIDYFTNTATFTSGSTAVEGQATVWTQAMKLGAIKSNTTGTWYKIVSVTDDTHLVISPPYATATETAVTYTIASRLPDLGGGTDQFGVITWGANPAGVDVTLGGLVSSSQGTPGTSITDITTDILPETHTSDWFVEPAVSGTLLTNPFRPFVTMLSDNSTLTEIQAWRLYALALILMLTVGAARAVKGHLLIAGIAASASIGATVALTIFPFWTLIFIIPAALGGVIAERSPSL